MANLTEVAEWTAGIYQLEEEDPVLGGENGIDNLQAKQLANRTLWLKALVELAAPNASPAFTGNPTVPTAVASDNSESIANTAFVRTAIAALVASSPAALDTLNELAAALGNDPNFATTVTSSIAGKQPLDPTLTALAAVATAANKLIFANGADSFATTDITALARTFLAADTAADARTAIGAVSSDAIHQIQPIEAAINTPVANAMTISLNPTSLDFRSSALSVGVPNTRTIAGPISLVVHAGATLGTVSGAQSRIMLLAIDNAGTVEAAVVNVAGGFDLSETGLISTTALSAAASSANVVYATIARANVPYRVVGCFVSTQAVAGNWATAPSLLQGAGGLGLQKLTEFGFNEQYQNFTGSRSAGVTYTNMTGKAIVVNVIANVAAGVVMQMTVSGAAIAAGTSPPAAAGSGGMFFIPRGATYVLSSVTSIISWYETR